MARERNTRLAYSTGGEVEQAPPKAAELAPPAKAPGIRVRLERRASSRVVTLVTGLPPAQGDALVRELKAACAAGGAWKDGVLELQGDHRDRIESALARRGLRSKRGVRS